MTSLPSIFVSHGAPTILLAASPAREFLARLGATVPRPTAILVASAHWQSNRFRLTDGVAPGTIHDFYGFPAELSEIVYPASGSPQLARDAHALLEAAGLSATLDERRGYDHGVWVPLRLGYPAADIPVVCLSLTLNGGPDIHMRAGRALAPLRERGVLIVGSGGLTHNLHELDWDHPDAPPAAWAEAFRTWAFDAITADRRDLLLAYRTMAPDAQRNHPTDEHLMPLFVALGAATPGTPGRRTHASMAFASLSMDAYAFD